jgi:hypothetical protein
VLIAERESLRTKNSIMHKEMDYLEGKNKQILCDLSKVESELRCTSREKADYYEQVHGFNTQKAELKA